MKNLFHHLHKSLVFIKKSITTRSVVIPSKAISILSKSKHNTRHYLVLTLGIVLSIFIYNRIAFAATYNFVQSSWTGGADTVSVATHASNQSNWNKYTSQSGLTVGSTLSLPSVAKSAVDDGLGLTLNTSYTGFNFPTSVVTAPDGTSVYVSNYSSSSISMYTRSTSTGALSGKIDYTVGTFPFNVTVSPDGTSVYVANYGTTTVSMFSRNTSTGALSGKTDYTTGAGPYGISISPDGASVYVTNYGTTTVSMFSRNTSTGALSGKIDYMEGTNPYGVTTSLDGKFVYVTNYNASTVSMYSRNTSTGTLSGKTDYATGANPYSVTISSDGNSAYVTNYGSSTVSMYSRSTSTGALSGKTDYVTGGAPFNLTLSPNGSLLYVTNYVDMGSGILSVFPRNTITGSLFSRNDIVTGGYPYGVSASSDGMSVYVSVYFGSILSRYTISGASGTPGFVAGTNSLTAVSGSGSGASVILATSTGSLSLLNPATTTTSATPEKMVISPDGAYLYVTNAVSSTVSGFSRNPSTGLLSGKTDYVTGNGPQSVVMSSDGTSLYTNNSGSSTISMFSRNTSTGVLSSKTDYPTGSTPYIMTISPDGKSVYVTAFYSGVVTLYSRDPSTGALSGRIDYNTGTWPYGVAVSPDNNSVYVSNYGDGTMYLYPRNTSTGALSAVTSYTTAFGSREVIVSPDSKSVYYTNYNNSTVSVFPRNTSTGVLSAKTDYATGANPIGLTVSPDGKSVYAGNYGTTTVSMFFRNTSTGLLSTKTDYTLGGSSPQGVIVSPDNAYTYVSNVGSNSISQFSRSLPPSSGTFTSSVINLGLPSSLSTLSYSKTTNASTSVTMDVRAGNTATPDGTWSSWTTNVSSGGSISGLSGNQYVQYRANLSTTDLNYTPSLDDVTISYSQYSTSGTLVSSIYDTQSTSNLVSGMKWNATGTSSTEVVKFQVRSGAATSTMSGWCGPSIACDGSDYFTDPQMLTALPNNHPLRNGTTNRYFQYQVFLTSGGGGTPTLTSATVVYVVNAPPAFDATYGTNGVTAVQATSTDPNFGKVNITYRIKDSDSTSGTVNPGFVTPSFEYSIDGGSTWNAIASTSLAVSDTSNKAVDNTNFTTYTATWTATSSATSTNIFNSNTEIRVTVNDNEGANNITRATSSIITIDTKAPTLVSRLDTSTSTPSVVITSTDDSPIRYAICNNASFPQGGDTQGNTCAWSSFGSNLTNTNVSIIPTGSSTQSQTTYVKVMDNYGNVTSSTLVAPPTPANFIFADVSNPAASSYGEYLSWANSSGATTYSVYYATTTANGSAPSNSAYTFLASTTNAYYNHVIGNISPMPKYWYKVTALSANGDLSNYAPVVNDVPDSYGTSIPDTTAPVISATSTTAITSTTATVNLHTDKIAIAMIAYGTTFSSTCTYASSTITSVYATSSSVYLTSLTPSTPYYFCMQAVDTLGNVNLATTSSVSGGSFTTLAATAYPVISSVTTSSINNNAFTVSWTTSTSSDSYVSYATTSAFTNVLSGGNPTLVPQVSAGVYNHQVIIAGLTSSTTYYFSVKSTDMAGNSTTDSNSGNYYRATTTTDTAPVISATSTSSLLANSVNINFTTDKLATSTVLYGSTFSSSCIYTASTTSTVFATAQSIYLSNLNASTTYYYCLRSTDVLGTTNTTIQGGSFTTNSGPAITNIHLGTLTDTTATILFDTATSSDSYIYYATATSSNVLVSPLYTGNASSTVNGYIYNHSVTLTGLTVGTPYYYYVKSTDANGNFSTDKNSNNFYTIPGNRDLTPPVISNITTPVKSIDSAAVVWQTNKSATTQIFYGTTPGVYDSQSILDTTKTIYHVVALASTTVNGANGNTDITVANNILTPNTTYYFIAVSTDNSGNTATSTEGHFATNHTDVTPPVITSIDIPTATLKSTSAVITFNTDTVSTSTVEYVSGIGTWTTVNDNTYDVTHSVTLPNLSSNTTYSYRIKAGDAIGNVSDYAIGIATTFTTASGPLITGVTANSITDNGATIEWNTSTSSDSYVYYSTVGDLSNPISVGTAAQVTCSDIGTCSHSVTISNLVSGRTYYYYVKSSDTLGDTVVSNNNLYYYSFVTNRRTLPPVISNIANPVISSVSAVVVWQTDEPATTQIKWGSTTDALTHSTNIDNIKSLYHIVTLSANTMDADNSPQALLPDTPYYFRVFSVDANGNDASSTVQTFSTTLDGQTVIVNHIVGGDSAPAPQGVVDDKTPPTILTSTTTDVGAFNAEVDLSSDKEVLAFVSYGETAAYGSTEGDKDYSSSKKILLKKLQTGTTYHYQIKVIDKFGNSTVSDDLTFTTLFISELSSDRSFLDKATDLQGKIEALIESSLPSLSPPFLSTPEIVNIGESSATVLWTTNIKTIGHLKYASDDEYTANNNDYTLDVPIGTDKEIKHTVDLSNLKPNTKYHIQAKSYVFPQLEGKSEDLTFITKAAKIHPSVAEKKNDGFTVVWNTDEPTTSILEYKNTRTGEKNLITDDSKKLFHSVKLDHLPSATTYNISVSGVNDKGNTLDSNETLTVTTSSDVVPPVISNFKVDNALVPGRTDRIQTVVGWMTDELANAAIYYEEGTGSLATSTASSTKVQLASKVESLDTYSTNHILIIPNLKPGAIYRIKVTSTDQSGNMQTFGPRTIITPQQTESVLDIIFKNFEDTFKFLRK